ncbi:cyclic nucleotide-binding protein [Legionella steelei]|uniref:Cyclic nucleotide-binding protein n=1 Tax=Legionella steelei TaxID=947033 RepID=A0A0W0ZP34_9GAMM|nr:cyclic nucleotide-binding domain-containing protein [Legionella steelei]KTD70744.1 cyclic nucleotide-binding protein [Legionella steelei]
MNQVQQGLLPPTLAEKITQEYLLQIRHLSKQHPEKLKLDPHNLLRQIRFFKDSSKAEIEAAIQLLKEHHAPPEEIVIRQGDTGDSLYLIMRGVIRVIREDDNQNIEVATLMAGDFFGELALLHHIKRTATCKAITPCILYILTKNDFEILIKRFPNMQKIIFEEARKREEK